MIGKTRQSQAKLQVEEIFSPGIGKARGILRWPPPAGQFQHVRQQAPPDLTTWIESYWMVTWDLPQPFLQETLPHPNVYLVFEERKCVVGGVSTRKFSRVLKGKSGVFGVKFKPGGFRPFLKPAVATLLNSIIPARRVFGEDAARLEGDWDSLAWRANKMVDVANAFFRSRLPQPDEKIARVDEIIKSILEQREIKTVDDLAEQSGMRKRGLQRLFHEYVGITPKWVIRRYRLHELVEVLNSGAEPDWAQVALELGYFDQAHLINDFKSIVGSPPSQYQKGR
jgi:AraC-like DNA-binding protein